MFLHHQEAESAFPPSSPGAAPGPGPAPRRLLPQRPGPAPPPRPRRPLTALLLVPPQTCPGAWPRGSTRRSRPGRSCSRCSSPSATRTAPTARCARRAPGPVCPRGEGRRGEPRGPGAGGVSGAIPPSHRQQVPGPLPRQRDPFLGPGVAVTAALSALPVRPPCSPSPGGLWTASSGSRRGHATRPRGPPALPG